MVRGEQMINWWLRMPLALIFFFLIFMAITNTPLFYKDKSIEYVLILIDFAFLIVTVFPVMLQRTSS